MKIFELLKDVAKNYIKDFFKKRKTKSFKENLFLFPLLAALLLVCIVLISSLLTWIDKF